VELNDKIEKRLRAQRHALFQDLAAEGEFIWPAYQGLSLANVPATLFSLLGRDPSTLAPPLSPELWVGLEDQVQRVVMILLDAVGFLSLCRQLGAGRLPFLQRAIKAGRFAPLTSVFPSTTTAALTSLHTGHTPAGHGMLAYILYLKRFAMLVEMIGMRPLLGRGSLVDWGFDPEAFVPLPGIGRLLAQQDVRAAHFINGAFVNTPLSRVFYRDYATLSAVYSPADLFVDMRQFLTDHPAEKVLLSGYWGSLDTIGHMRGPDHPGWAAELENLLKALEDYFWRPLPPALHDGTVLVLLADHGQATVDYGRSLFLSEHPVLDRALLLPPAGESRAAFLYPRAGRLDDVRASMEQFVDRFATVLSADALEAGLFGPQPWLPDTPMRVGDLVSVAREPVVIENQRDARRAQIIGRHGGLTPEEMLIPYLAVRLEALQ
jgi:hypothetical protein